LKPLSLLKNRKSFTATNVIKQNFYELLLQFKKI